MEVSKARRLLLTPPRIPSSLLNQENSGVVTLGNENRIVEPGQQIVPKEISEAETVLGVITLVMRRMEGIQSMALDNSIKKAFELKIPIGYIFDAVTEGI